MKDGKRVDIVMVIFCLKFYFFFCCYLRKNGYGDKNEINLIFFEICYCLIRSELMGKGEEIFLVKLIGIFFKNGE